VGDLSFDTRIFRTGIPVIQGCWCPNDTHTGGTIISHRAIVLAIIAGQVIRHATPFTNGFFFSSTCALIHGAVIGVIAVLRFSGDTLAARGRTIFIHLRVTFSTHIINGAAIIIRTRGSHC